MDTKTLAAEMQAAVKQAQDIIEAHKGKRLGAEKKTELDALLARTSDLRVQLDEVHDLEAKTKDLVALNDYLSQPQYKVPRGEKVGNGETDTHKALSAMEWEVKSGMIYAPTSLGKSVAMYPEDVLFGETDDADAAEYFRATRASFQPEYRKTFLKFIKLSVKYKDQGIAYSKLDGTEQKALSEGTDTAGGFLVPPDVQAEVLIRLPLKSVMRQLCRVVPTSRDLLTFPMLAANTGSTGGSIYTSGFVGDWAGETPAFTDVNPSLGAFPIPVRKIRCATKVSNDLVADSVFPFLSFLSQDGATNMALVEDNGFITGQTAFYTNGSGVATNAVALQPLGLLVASATANQVGVAGTTAHKVSGSGASTSSAPLIPAISANLPQQYHGNAKWLMHRLTELEIRQLTDTTGRPVYAPGYLSPTGSAFEAFTQLQGKPVVLSDFMPQDGTALNPVIAYADFSNYIIAQRAGITVTILRERFADTDQTGIILWERVGGAMWNSDAVRFGTV